MLERFYCPDAAAAGRAILEGDEARHLIRVRRVGVGEVVEVFDGRGSSYRAEVAAIGRDRAELAILGPSGADRSPRLALTLATAVPKGERFDWLVEKATELGVDRLVPLVTSRSVVDPRSAKLDRLRRTIVEACKQCRRDRLMDLDLPTSWEALVEAAGPSTRLIAHPGAPGIAATGWRAGSGPAMLAIGPEGGFSGDEVGRAIGRGWAAVGLGPTILRVETAALAGCSTLLALAEAADGDTTEGRGATR